MPLTESPASEYNLRLDLRSRHSGIPSREPKTMAEAVMSSVVLNPPSIWVMWSSFQSERSRLYDCSFRKNLTCDQKSISTLLSFVLFGTMATRPPL